MKKISSIIFISSLFIILGSCFSLKYDFKGGVNIPAHIQSYSVQYFDNRAKLIEPTFSQRFTDELKAYLESNTNLRLVNGVGDVDFSGVISKYDITPQAIAAGDQASMTRFTIAVKLEYKDQKIPENEFEKTISAYREFPTSDSFNTVEESLSQEIMEEIIEQIFNAAFVNW